MSRLDPSSVHLGWICCCTLIRPLCPHEHEVLCHRHCILLAVCIHSVNVTIFSLVPSSSSSWSHMFALHYLGSSFAPLLSQISHFMSSCVACNACLDGHLQWKSHLGTSHRDHHFTRFIFCSSALPDLSLCVLMCCIQCMLGRHLQWRSHLGTSRCNHHFTRFVFYSSALPHLSHHVLICCMQCMLGCHHHLQWRSQLGPSHCDHHSPQQHGTTIVTPKL